MHIIQILFVTVLASVGFPSASYGGIGGYQKWSGYGGYAGYGGTYDGKLYVGTTYNDQLYAGATDIGKLCAPPAHDFPMIRFNST